MADVDIINSINNSIVQNLQSSSMSEEQAVKDIALSLRAVIQPDGIIISQSSLDQFVTAQRLDSDRASRNPNRRDVFEERRNRAQAANPNQTNQPSNNQSRNDAFRDDDFDFIFNRQRSRRRRGSFFDDVMDRFEGEITTSIFGSAHPIRDALNSSINNLAQRLGTDVDGLGATIGTRLGRLAGDAIKNNPIGNRLARELIWVSDHVTSGVTSAVDNIGERLSQIQVDDIVSSGQVAADVTQQVVDASAEQAASDMTQQVADASSVQSEVDVTQQVVDASAASMADAVSSTTANVSDVAVETIESISDITQSNIENAAELVSETMENAADAINEAADQLSNNNDNNSNSLSNPGGVIGNALDTGMDDMLDSFASGSSVIDSVTAGLGSMGTALSAANPVLLAVGVGAGALLDVLSTLFDTLTDLIEWGIEPIQEGISGLIDAFMSAVTQVESRNSKYLQLWRDRVKSDIEGLRKLSYEVIEDAANKVTSTWDNILKTVTATQGYDKAGVQDLWASYADRLSKEGLSSVISSADIMDNLESVLKSGLSGAVAEEFSYVATLLNNAMPTEDFFQYASTYASLAANAIKNGKSQEEALKLANSKLTQFASNLLYASRQIAGGFTTSLTNSADLFAQSAKIALTSRTGDVSTISGVLTSVSAIVGAIAPDLADSLVTAVTNAATGGNSSEITALRSMAGTGASNTAFLKALSENPQEVFTTLFRNLAQLQNMSADNYMEVAEGLSQVFGLSMDAFARVDFDYLADAISEMNVNQTSLAENIKLLMSGESTSTAAQLRMQKINEYMVEEGLAYVLDNEAARMVQQHMWEEQLAREITESTFAVEITGQAFTSLQNIFTGIKRLSSIFSGTLVGNSVENFKLTALESAVQEAEIEAVVKAGVVGTGTVTELRNLTVGGEELNLTKSYIDYLTGEDRFSSKYETLNKALDAVYSQDSSIGGAASAILSNPDLYKKARDKVAKDYLDDHNNHSSGGTYFGESHTSGGTYFGESVSKQDYADMAASYSTPVSRYKPLKMVSKSTASAVQSGDWRTDTGYDSTWDKNYVEDITAKTQADAEKLSSSLVTDISDFITDRTESVNSDLDAMIDKNHREFSTQEDIMQKVLDTQASALPSSFNDWKQNFEKEWNAQTKADWIRQGKILNDREYRDKTLEEILADYGADVSMVEQLFNEQQNARTSAANKARELHEVQFWEDMQNFATKDFPWYMREWERYYIQHEAYGNVTAGAYDNVSEVEENGTSRNIASLLMASEEGQGDAILALANMLTDNATYQNQTLESLKDPQLQTNAILAKILLVVEAIMQQNNETSIVSVPTSLSSLGLGLTNS